MPDIHQISYCKLMEYIEDSFESLSYKSSRLALTNQAFFETVIRCLEWYEQRIRCDRHWPDLQHISIIDYNIYRCTIKRQCEALKAKYKSRLFFTNPEYIKRLEHIRYILDNHFIYWEWKINR